LLADAPALIDKLDDESKNDFDLVKEYLTKINIPFEVDPQLVRGLDYYSKTTFEIISGKVGAQNALLGGGRYDLLAEQLGGKSTPAVGFAAGIERILLACENENSFMVDESAIDVYLIRIDKELELKVSELASVLRRKGLRVEYDYLQRSVKAQMREANKFNARFALFIGGDEYEQGKMNLKDMVSSEQKFIPIDNLSEVINNVNI